jgi:hypothetical protein
MRTWISESNRAARRLKNRAGESDREEECESEKGEKLRERIRVKTLTRGEATLSAEQDRERRDYIHLYQWPSENFEAEGKVAYAVVD